MSCLSPVGPSRVALTLDLSPPCRARLPVPSGILSPSGILPIAWVTLACLAVFGLDSAKADRPSADTLVPATTKLFASIPDVPRFREDFDKTEFGQLLDDPSMESFRGSLREQLRRRLETEGVRLGLTIEDVEGIASGEVAIARIQPGNRDGAFATLFLIDAAGNEPQLTGVLTKVDQTLAREGATRSTVRIGDQTAVRHVIPARRAGERARTVDYVNVDGMLIACDNEPELLAALGRLAGGADSLSTLPAYKTARARAIEAAGGDVAPHASWFIEPFGAAAVARASVAARVRQSNDILGSFRKQGFDAIKGAAGVVTLRADGHDLVHHSFVLAPADPKAKSGDKYRAAAKMLEFPSTESLKPADWVPASISLAAVGNWNIKKAFEAASPLVNDIAGDEVFEGTLESLKLDPSGPRIDIRNEIVAHLGQRIYVISDQTKPLGPDSERLLTAIELKNPNAVRIAIAKALEKDSRPIKAGDITIWEYFNEPLDVEVDEPSFGFGSGGGFGSSPGRFDDGPENETVTVEPLFSKLYVTVLHGYLMIATKESIIKDLLQPRSSLKDEPTYQTITDALDGMADGQDAMRTFTRTNEAYATTYELLRQGKMPEAETLLGKLLNRALAPEDATAKRQAEFDGSTLPPFESISDRLMPSGVRVLNQEDGWLVVGCILGGEP